MICGIAPLTAVTVYSLAGFSELGGRLLLGVLADRLGAKHVLVGGLFVQAHVDRHLPRGRPSRRILCAVGNLRPRLWRRDAALRRAGARIFWRAHHGQACSAPSRPLRASAWRWARSAGGWVFDTFHAYNWLYVGSFAIGIAAAAVHELPLRPGGRRNRRSIWGARRREPTRGRQSLPMPLMRSPGRPSLRACLASA